jgi:hypothetical protein
VTYFGQTGGWSESTLILINESQSKITSLIRVDQSQASKLGTEDRQGRTDRQRSDLKGVAKKKGCFEFHNFGLSFLKENDRYPFLFSRIWKF